MKKIVIIIFSLALVVLVTFGIIKVKNKNVQGSTNNVQVETAEEIKQTEDKVKQQEIVDNTKVEVSDIPVEVNENKAEDKGVTQENATQPVEQVHTQYHEEKAAKTSTKKENTKVE